MFIKNTCHYVVIGLKLYGQNPADCIIDLYQIPFHPPTSELATAVDKTKLAIGTEEVTLGRFDEIQKVTTKKLGTIDLSTSLNPNFPIFGDWRDYLSYGLYIYLPYAGIYSLNPEKYIVVGGNVHNNDGTLEKPKLGEMINRFLDEEALDK